MAAGLASAGAGDVATHPVEDNFSALMRTNNVLGDISRLIVQYRPVAVFAGKRRLPNCVMPNATAILVLTRFAKISDTATPAMRPSCIAF